MFAINSRFLRNEKERDMNTTAIKLSDTLAEALSIPMEKARKVEAGIRGIAREETAKSAERTADRHVKKAFATELRHLATREDLKDLKIEMKDDMHKMERRLVLWMVGVLVTIFAGFIATILAILQTKIPLPQ